MGSVKVTLMYDPGRVSLPLLHQGGVLRVTKCPIGEAAAPSLEACTFCTGSSVVFSEMNCWLLIGQTGRESTN